MHGLSIEKAQDVFVKSRRDHLPRLFFGREMV